MVDDNPFFGDYRQLVRPLLTVLAARSSFEHFDNLGGGVSPDHAQESLSPFPAHAELPTSGAQDWLQLPSAGGRHEDAGSVLHSDNSLQLQLQLQNNTAARQAEDRNLRAVSSSEKIKQSFLRKLSLSKTRNVHNGPSRKTSDAELQSHGRSGFNEGLECIVGDIELLEGPQSMKPLVQRRTLSASESDASFKNPNTVSTKHDAPPLAERDAQQQDKAHASTSEHNGKESFESRRRSYLLLGNAFPPLITHEPLHLDLSQSSPERLAPCTSPDDLSPKSASGCFTYAGVSAQHDLHNSIERKAILAPIMAYLRDLEDLSLSSERKAPGKVINCDTAQQEVISQLGSAITGSARPASSNSHSSGENAERGSVSSLNVAMKCLKVKDSASKRQVREVAAWVSTHPFHR